MKINIRDEYYQSTLNEHTIEGSPLQQFDKWFNEAIKSGEKRANAFTLATHSEDGFPQARILLIKELTSQGFVFFSNYSSRKGLEMQANPKACMNFYWPILDRQIRITGIIKKTSRQISSDYFHSRPRGSQISAAISKQSQNIDTRENLIQQCIKLDNNQKNEIECPPNWGGYILEALEIEFWQGLENRLHDRILYQRKELHHPWKKSRIQP
jgi:pyridoxamine 5'-phosphate oxidase